MDDTDVLTEKMTQIRAMKSDALKKLWQELYFKEAPALHPNLLRMRLIWRVQEIMNGGLSKAATDALTSLRKRLRKDGRLAKKTSPDILKTGTRLNREYNGELHEVLVVKAGFEFRGQVYRSLSKVARVITGTQWNGPAFFGLRTPYAKNKK